MDGKDGSALGTLVGGRGLMLRNKESGAVVSLHSTAMSIPQPPSGSSGRHDKSRTANYPGEQVLKPQPLSLPLVVPA